MNNIPNGWEKCLLRTVCSTFSGGTPAVTNKKYYGTEIPFIRSGEIHSDHTELFLTEEGLKNSSAKMVNKGDLLYALYGATSGEVAISKINGAINQAILCLRSKELSNYYLATWLEHNKSKILNKYIQGGQGNLSAEIIKNLIILLPPFAEQEKIAEILGIWDRAIEELTDLIAEKKELKRGLMQRLLTGTQRLPGFTKPWKKIKLSDVLEECTETTTINNQYDILTSSRRGIFKQEDYFDKQVASQDNIGYKIIHNGDFTYRAMTDDDKFCFNQLTDLEIGIVSPAYAVFQTKKIPGNILKFILNSGRFGYELLKEAQGGTRKSLKYNSLIKLQIYVPDDEKEMDKLSYCLFVADSEIDLLNQRLDVLKEQKRGLMQKLLTGEIRVKVDVE